MASTFSPSPESDAVQEYLFLGYEPRFYPLWEGQTFTADQGDVKAFENPPTDGLWVPAEKPAKAAKAPAASDPEEVK